MGSKEIKEQYKPDPSQLEEAAKLTPQTIKDMPRSQIIRLNRIQRSGLFTDTLWKKMKREKQEAIIPEPSIFRQLRGGYFEPTSKGFSFMQRYRRISMLQIDVANILKKQETSVKNLESNDDTSKHLRTLKTWLLAQHKKSQISISIFTIVPAACWAFFTKRGLFVKLLPMLVAYVLREQLAMFHLQRQILRDFDQYKQRLMGELQGHQSFDHNNSDLAKQFRDYFEKRE